MEFFIRQSATFCFNTLLDTFEQMKFQCIDELDKIYIKNKISGEFQGLVIHAMSVLV